MSRQAFGLIEMLLVLCLVMAALFQIHNLITTTGRTVGFNDDRARAHLLASHIIERFRAESFEGLVEHLNGYDQGRQAIADDALLGLVHGLQTEGSDTLFARYHREVSFEETVHGLYGTLTCRITWADNQRVEHEYLLSTIIRNGAYHHGK